MQISNITFNHKLKLNEIKYGTNPLSFGSQNIQPDTFEKSEESKLALYNKQLEKNPNTAFLYNPNLTHIEKMQELNRHPEIISVGDAVKNTHVGTEAVKDDIFDFDVLETEYMSRNQKKTKKTRLIDTSSEKNKKTMEILSKKGKDLFDYPNFRNKFKMPLSTFREYMTLGRFEKFSVDSENPNNEVESRIIDTTSPKNQKAIYLYETLNQRGVYLDRLLGAERKDKIYANAHDLINYGIYDEEEIASLIQDGIIDGKIEQDNNSDEVKVLVNLNDRKTEEMLKKIRSKNCLDIETFSQRYDIPVSDIEDAFLDGKIDLLYKPLFIGELGRTKVNTKSEKTSAFLTQKLLQKAIEEEILQEHKLKSRILNSLKMKITWYLCPETKKVAEKIVQKNPEIRAILAKKNEIEKMKMDIRQEETIPDDNIEEEIEETIPTLTESETRLLNQYFKGIWKIAGTDEFSQARRKANEIIKEYKNHGIGSIQDQYIKNLLLNFEKKCD